MKGRKPLFESLSEERTDLWAGPFSKVFFEKLDDDCFEIHLLRVKVVRVGCLGDLDVGVVETELFEMGGQFT